MHPAVHAYKLIMFVVVYIYRQITYIKKGEESRTSGIQNLLRKPFSLFLYMSF